MNLTPEQIQQIAAAMGQNPVPGVEQTPALPPNYDPRLGGVQALQKEHYDHVLYGIGQTFDPDGEEFFTNSDRCGQIFLCSLKEKGKFSDKKEFHAYGVALCLEFGNPDNYELFHWNLMVYQQDETKKMYLWADRLAAGGGTFGTDQNTGAFHLCWGVPDPMKIYWLAEPWVLSLDRTFLLKSQFMPESKTFGAFDPCALLNADSTHRKLMRLTLVGREFGDIVNR